MNRIKQSIFLSVGLVFLLGLGQAESQPRAAFPGEGQPTEPSGGSLSTPGSVPFPGEDYLEELSAAQETFGKQCPVNTEVDVKTHFGSSNPQAVKDKAVAFFRDCKVSGGFPTYPDANTLNCCTGPGVAEALNPTPAPESPYTCTGKVCSTNGQSGKRTYSGNFPEGLRDLIETEIVTNVKKGRPELANFDFKIKLTKDLATNTVRNIGPAGFTRIDENNSPQSPLAPRVSTFEIDTEFGNSLIHGAGTQNKYGFLQDLKDPNSFKPFTLERVILHEVGFHGALKNNGLPRNSRETEDAAVSYADSHVTDGSVRGNSRHPIIARSSQDKHFYALGAANFLEEMDGVVGELKAFDNRFGTNPYEIQTADDNAYYRLDTETDQLVLAMKEGFYTDMVNGTSQFVYKGYDGYKSLTLLRLMAHTEALSYMLNVDSALKNEARNQGGAIPVSAHVAAIEFINALGFDQAWDPSDLRLYHRDEI